MLVETGLEQRTFCIAGGEEAKSMGSVEDLCRGFAGFGLTRADLVVGVGGGVVTDVAGFAAAVYHRGVRVAHVSTTLLGQIDAAIGGKTGVNLPEGKNLVGAFWQPVAVICDTEVLSSLPPASTAAASARWQSMPSSASPTYQTSSSTKRSARCVELKASIVSADERETVSLADEGATSDSGRALLNYGHTLAHTLETIGQYDLRHGEAVAVGLVYAARLARRLGRIGDDRVEQHDRVVSAYDLPSRLPAGADPVELVAVMGRDKKVTGGGLTFVLDGPAGLEVVRGVAVEAALSTLAELK